jgi:transcriptional regulator NrdR family protein
LHGGKKVGTKVQLKVVKTDGTVEEYLHTKVIGTVTNVLARAGRADMHIAEHLAEVVTYFLYHKKNVRTVNSSEIFSIIKAVLAATNYEDAAIAMSEHHYQRKLRRSRTEVVPIDIKRLADAELLVGRERSMRRARWDKSRIVDDLVAKHDVDRQTARAIASMVEEKVFSVGLTVVPASLVKQLVLGDTAALLRAQKQLQTA